MPIKRCRLKSGDLGWKWGDSGKCYPTRAQAAKQARAAHAAGYREWCEALTDVFLLIAEINGKEDRNKER